MSFRMGGLKKQLERIAEGAIIGVGSALIGGVVSSLAGGGSVYIMDVVQRPTTGGILGAIVMMWCTAVLAKFVIDKVNL